MSKKFSKIYLSLLTGLCLTVSVISPPAEAAKKEPENPGPTAKPLPKFFARHVEEGNKLLVSGKLKEALDEFYVAKTINPDYFPAYVGIGQIHIIRGELRQAVENYQTAIGLLNPAYGTDHVKRGDYFASKGLWKKAIDDYWEVLRIDTQAGLQYTVAMKHIRFGNEKAAIKAFELTIQMDDDYPDPHFQLGNIYYTKNDLKKAIPEYELAVKYDLGNPRYQYYLANAYYKNSQAKKVINMDELNQSVVHFEKAISLGVRERNAHFNLGNAYLLQGNYDNAIKKFQDCLTLKLQDEEVYYNLANAYFKKAMKIPFKWDGRSGMVDRQQVQQNDNKFDLLFSAVKNYHIALGKKEDYAQVYFDLGVAYYRLSELKPNAKWLGQMITEKTAKDYYQKGTAYFKTDMSMRAIEQFDKFLSKSDNAKMKKLASEVSTDIKKDIGLIRTP